MTDATDVCVIAPAIRDDASLEGAESSGTEAGVADGEATENAAVGSVG